MLAYRRLIRLSIIIGGFVRNSFTFARPIVSFPWNFRVSLEIFLTYVGRGRAGSERTLFTHNLSINQYCVYMDLRFSMNPQYHFPNGWLDITVNLSLSNPDTIPPADTHNWTDWGLALSSNPRKHPDSYELPTATTTTARYSLLFLKFPTTSPWYEHHFSESFSLNRSLVYVSSFTILL